MNLPILSASLEDATHAVFSISPPSVCSLALTPDASALSCKCTLGSISLSESFEDAFFTLEGKNLTQNKGRQW